jgi:hypothetical protein
MTQQAFTIGRQSVYDVYMNNDPDAKKLGKRREYYGGWVWSSSADANSFLVSSDFLVCFPEGPSDFAVYELQLPTGWSVDVGPLGLDGVHHLINDAKLVRKC